LYFISDGASEIQQEKDSQRILEESNEGVFTRWRETDKNGGSREHASCRTGHKRSSHFLWCSGHTSKYCQAIKCNELLIDSTA
jgi:hypothetical protein